MTNPILSRQSAFALLLTGSLILVGCGGGSSATATPGSGSGSGSGTGTTPTATLVQVNLGDAPADWVMAFGMTVNSITLTSVSGSTVNVVPASTPMEMAQLMGTMQTVSTLAVPQGSYTQAVVTFSAVNLGYMNPITKAYATATMPGPFTATVPFSPAFTVGASPMALDFDLNLGASLAADSTGAVSLTPVITAAPMPVSATGPTPWNGSLRMMGSVSGVTGSQFTLGSMMGLQTTTFTTSGTTTFAGTGLTGMGGMAAGLMVAVDATLQADGSFLAQRVESLGMIGSAGMMGGGLVTGLTGNPPTQLTLSASAGQGGGMMPASMGGTLTVSIPTGTPYSLDADGVDLTGLPFTPDFSGASLAKGQRIAVLSASGMMSGGGMGGGMMGSGSLGTVTASQVRLEPQALHGAVSGYAASGSQATFTLTLATDSAFAALTGASTIQVYQQAGTRMMGVQAPANGQDLAVRGLLFNDAGTYRLVAAWITLP